MSEKVLKTFSDDMIKIICLNSRLLTGRFFFVMTGAASTSSALLFELSLSDDLEGDAVKRWRTWAERSSTDRAMLLTMQASQL